MALTIESPAFLNKGEIPTDNTCDGEDVSPGLQWNGIPPKAKSLALIVDDPDAPDPAAPKRRFVHWVLYNIPPDARGLAERAGKANLPPGAREGTNDFRKHGYGGPCPPKGRHRYVFTLYALNTSLSGLDSPSKGDLETAKKGHVIEQTETIGTFERGG